MVCVLVSYCSSVPMAAQMDLSLISPDSSRVEYQLTIDLGWVSFAAKVGLWRTPQHVAEHFNEGAHAIVTDTNRCLCHRIALCEEFKSRKQSRLLPPSAKRHAHLTRKRTHESTTSHAGIMRPLVQRAFVRNVVQQAVSNS